MRISMPFQWAYLFILMVIFLFPLKDISAQSFYTTLHIGAISYMGDLSPRPIDISLAPGNLAFGISVGKDVNNWLGFRARFMTGKLTGDDAYSEDISRRTRNLSFSTPIYEYGLYSDFKINKIWKSLDKYKLRLYFTLGLNAVHFNPQAYYHGQWIDLQPIGTEGQTLTGSGMKKYSLTTFSRAIGFIVEFDINRRMAFGLEVAPRKTYTDYLDDVSGTYVNYDEMVKAGNILGANLSNRMGEYLKTENVRVASGTPRGKPENNDWYTFFGLHIKYTFGPWNQKTADKTTKEENIIKKM